MSTTLSLAALMEEIAAWNTSTMPTALFVFAWKMALCMNLLALVQAQQQPQLDLAVPILLGLEMATVMTSTIMKSALMMEGTVALKM